MIILYMLAVSGVLAVGSFYAGRKIFLFMPSKWLCEYGEVPGEEHLPENRLRKYFVFAVVYAVLIFSSFALKLFRIFNAGEAGWKTAGSLVIVFIAAVVLLAISFSDIRYFIIPDQLCLVLILLASVNALLHENGVVEGLRTAFFGMLISGGLMLFAAIVSCIFYGADALGTGDIKLIAAVGAVVGSGSACLLYVLTSIPSAFFFAIGMMAGKFKASSVHPLGPWISAAALFCLACC